MLESKPLESKPAGGRIVFITSISAYTASINRAGYCISKAGLSMSIALFSSRLRRSRARDNGGESELFNTPSGAGHIRTIPDRSMLPKQQGVQFNGYLGHILSAYGVLPGRNA
jgi:NAD(P)-dependent dehydrogenase (short-subunit alcohol dehydrogenase family)